MTTANQKATRTYRIVNGGSREALFLQLQLVGRSDVAKLKPFVFEVDNNLRTVRNGRAVVVPGKIEVRVDGIEIPRDINGRRDGDVMEVRGEVVNDSSFTGARGRFMAIYDTRHRGRQIDRMFHYEVNTITLWFDNVEEVDAVLHPCTDTIAEPEVVEDVVDACSAKIVENPA